MEARKSLTSFTGRRQLQNDGTHRAPAPLQTEISRRFSVLKSVTPPDTPLKSPNSQHTNGDDQALFHNYLRAFCEFEPPTEADVNDEALLLTVHIRPGDLVLVHSVHANGWADGTVLTTNTRGWLPTNYCETFDHPYMRHLLNAMTQFWDLLGASEDGNLSTFVRQDYVRPLIAGVRYLLEHADCLHREAALVQRSTSLRRLRKGLLADLSMLVTLAKRLQEMVSEPVAGEGVETLIDELMAKACKVVTRAIGFVDMLAQEGAGVQPLTKTKHLSSISKASGSIRSASTRDMGRHSRESWDRIDSAKQFSSTADDASGDGQLDNRRRTRTKSGTVSHRLSMVRREQHSRSGNLASDRLAKAHDLCISHIGGFIGLYLHPSSPASELVAMTQNLLSACSTMLEIVDKISAFEPGDGSSIQRAGRDFQLKLEELTTSTEDLVSGADCLDDDIVLDAELTNHLVHVGTGLIRTVGDCVVKIRRVIEQIGDFDLDNPPVIEEELSLEDQAFAGAGASAIDSTATAEHGSHERSGSDEAAASTIHAPSPRLREKYVATTEVADFAPVAALSPKSTSFPTSHNSLSIPEHAEMTEEPIDDLNSEAFRSLRSSRAHSGSPTRKCSVGASISNSTDTRLSSMRDSSVTAVSEVSTRATTPDHSKEGNDKQPELSNSFASTSSLRSAATADAGSDTEAQLLQKTYANELTLNKDGQVTGGSLPALVEQLTTSDSAPDAQFFAAFLVTFRSFTSPIDLAQALIHRFDYVGDDQIVGLPVRLRVYNAFKAWLENYWNAELDQDALGEIRFFALHTLKPLMEVPGERLLDLIRKLSALYQDGGTANSHMVSQVGAIRTAIANQSEIDRNSPEPVMTKNQLAALRKAVGAEGKDTCSIADFDPLEVARQLTVLASRIFCDIQPEELLSLEWNKKESSKAENVRNMCILNTDMAHMVGETILTPEDAKKRGVVIKHWSKVATRCLELNNYESLMAIMCSLNSSVVQRLKRTWEVVGKKTKARIDELNTIVDFSRNHTSLRRRLENVTTPCLPFLGIFLTDLTMVDAAFHKHRELRHTTTDAGETLSVINFDKHMRLARIVSQLQRFQTPYRLREVAEMQAWLRIHLERMRGRHAQMVGDFHRRSLYIEPRREAAGGVMDAPQMPELRQALECSMMGDGHMLEGGEAGGAARRGTEPSLSDARTVSTARPKTSHTTSAATIKSFKPRGQTFEFLLRTNFPFQRQQTQAAAASAEESEHKS